MRPLGEIRVLTNRRLPGESVHEIDCFLAYAYRRLVNTQFLLQTDMYS